MKVYQVNSVCGFGSTGRIALEIAGTLAATGQQCRIGYGRGHCDDPRTFCFEKSWEVKAHGLLSRLTDRQGFYSAAATRRLIRDIRAYAPDVIHLHNLHGYYLHLPTLFSFLRNYGVPVVWTLHDCWAFTGHCAHYDHAGCDKWKTGCFACPQKGQYPASRLLDNSRKNYADKKKLFSGIPNLTVVTPSHWLAEQVSHSFLQEYPIVPIYNGIDLEVFHPGEGDIRGKYGLDGREIVLGVANAWDERKGLSDFIALEPMLSPEYQLVLVGLTAEQKRTLPKQITGILRTDSVAELAQLYSAAEVYVNLSVEETMGLTTVEAMACGTPVVTYDRTAVPEVVDPACGQVVCAGKIADVADAIAKTDKQSVSDLCVVAAAKFDKRKKYQEYLFLYEKQKGNGT